MTALSPVAEYWYGEVPSSLVHEGALVPKDHPNSAPGVPMLFPAWIDRLQIKYVNPVIRRIARFLPTFAVITHRGRKSGASYETVVNAYRTGSVLAILLVCSLPTLPDPVSRTEI